MFKVSFNTCNEKYLFITENNYSQRALKNSFNL